MVMVYTMDTVPITVILPIMDIIAIIMATMVILGITLERDLQKLVQIMDTLDLVIWGLYMDMEYALVMAFIMVYCMELAHIMVMVYTMDMVLITATVSIMVIVLITDTVLITVIINLQIVMEIFLIPRRKKSTMIIMLS